MITFEEIKKDPGIRTYIKKADESLINLGFTEHSFAHVGLVAANSKYILETMGYSEREVELVQIAAYLHDIGNLVNRIDHSQSGAVMAFRLLDHLHMDPLDIAEVVTAIGYASLSSVEGKEGIKALTVGGVACSEETVLDGSYEIQRPFVLVTKTDGKLSEVAQAFFDYATSADASDLIRNAGAVPTAK